MWKELCGSLPLFLDGAARIVPWTTKAPLPTAPFFFVGDSMRPAEVKCYPHELKAQEQSNERNSESKQLQRLQAILSKKLARSEALLFPGSPTKVA